MKGWVACDLDGVLAEDTGWKGIEHIGKPIPAMVKRVKQWFKMGREVRCFTARAYNDPIAVHHVEQWLKDHDLHFMTVTCVKDRDCILILDDRAVRVEKNTGKPLNRINMRKPCRSM